MSSIAIGLYGMFALLGLIAARVPIAVALGMVSIIGLIETQNGAADEALFLNCPECIEDFHKQNTVYTGGIANGDYNFMCNKEIKSLADVKGKRIRTSGAGGRWVRALGAVPIGMAVPDAIEAYRRGSIDCVMGPMSWLHSFGLIDATKYVLEYPMGTYKVTGILLMNRDAWHTLTNAERAAIMKAMAFGSAQSIYNGHLVDINKGRKSVIDKGGKGHRGGAEFDSAFEAFKKNDLKAVSAAARKRGVKNPERIIKAYLKNLEKWEKIMAQTPKTAEAYEKVLWREIYSKIDPSKI